VHVACILFTLVFFLDVPPHDTLFVCSVANPTFLAPSHRLLVSANYAYPIRIRFPNIITGKVQSSRLPDCPSKRVLDGV